MVRVRARVLINLLTTDDECHATLAACYQLGNVFEDTFCASKNGGIGGGGQA